MRGNKYGARKIKTQDGEVFDSLREMRRWQDLKLMEKAGEISELQRQVKYPLIPKTKGKTRTERECVYYADFVYKDRSGETVVEDCKGFRTETYKVKRKLLLWLYGIEVLET